MAKIDKKKQELQLLDLSIKKLRDTKVYQQYLKEFLDKNQNAFDKHDTVEVSVNWIKQFIVDFIYWNNQEGKDRKFLQGAPIGAVLLEHHNNARLFLEKAGYDAFIDENNTLQIKKKEKKDVEKKQTKQSGDTPS